MENISTTFYGQKTRKTHSKAPRILLYLMFLVLMIDLMPGLGLGFGLGLSAKNLFLYLLLILIAIRIALQPSGLRLVDLDIHIPYLVLMAYAALTWAISTIFDPTYNSIRGAISFKNQLVDLYLFFFVFRYGIHRSEDYIWLLKAILVTLIISSLITLIDFFNIPDLGIIGEHKGRLEGPIGAANQYGALLAFLIPVCIGFMPRDTKRIGRYFWVTGILIMAALLVATGSRGALVAIIGGSILSVIYLRHYLNMRLVITYGTLSLILLVAVAAVVLIVYPELAQERLEKTTSGSLETASSGRLSIWRAALLVMLEWPVSFLVGYGWNAYEASGIWKSAHNEYLDRMFELGTIGLSINLYLLYVLVSRTRRLLSDSSENMRRLQIGYIFAVLIMFVDIFFVAIPDPWTVIWVITGLLFGLQSLVETNGQSAEDPTLKDSDQIENKHGLKRA